MESWSAVSGWGAEEHHPVTGGMDRQRCLHIIATSDAASSTPTPKAANAQLTQRHGSAQCCRYQQVNSRRSPAQAVLFRGRVGEEAWSPGTITGRIDSHTPGSMKAA